MRLFLFALLILAACGPQTPSTQPAAEAPVLLLVTMDTTRADYVFNSHTPGLNALRNNGLQFTRAYATAPQTLPSHVSMMSGLYPAGHGIHENARFLTPQTPWLASRLKREGWRTAAFVSAYPLSSEFGVARGFDRYDDQLDPRRNERPAKETTDLALNYLSRLSKDKPLFLWVHYFDPHYPYEPLQDAPADDFKAAYQAEIADMDQQIARLVDAVAQYRAQRPGLTILTADHGEGLGDHGEMQHGNLIYESVMHVPLLIQGAGVTPGSFQEPVSIRHIYGTALRFAGLDAQYDLREPQPEIVLGEAMKPFLQYGWSPQTAGWIGDEKLISGRKKELYDLTDDPGEQSNLLATRTVNSDLGARVAEYPLPNLDAAAPDLSTEQMERLSSLGYAASVSAPVIRDDAPMPAEMTHIFADLDTASDLFVQQQYARAAETFERILKSDPNNLSIRLRLATSYSLLGRSEAAMDQFRAATRLDEDAIDLRHTLGQHYFRTNQHDRAAELLTQVLAQQPNKRAALLSLGRIHEQQNQFIDASDLYQRALLIRDDGPLQARLGNLMMAQQRTMDAIEAFNQARLLQGDAFNHHLELGVCYLSQQLVQEAASLFEQVPSTDPRYPMALFKRAQAAALMQAPDTQSWINKAKANATPQTRSLINGERLFQ